MKLFNVLFLALSVSASTLLAPLYELLAQQVIDQGKTALDGIEQYLVNAGTPVAVIQEFSAALDGIDNAAVVEILKQIPLEDIMEGGLTADDFAIIFQDNSAFDAIDFSGLNNEIISNMDPATIASFEQGMDAFRQAAESLQDIFDSEITIYNFVAVITDTIDGLARLDGIFGFTSGSMSVVRDVLFWMSLATEKVLFVIENYQDYIYMYEDAITLTELEFTRRIQDSLDGVCTDEFNAMDLAIDVTKFSSTVVLDNWSEPASKTVDIWNSLIGNLPYLDDYSIPTTYLTTVEAMVQTLLDSIGGSLVEVRLLVLPFNGQINNVVQSISGC